MFQQSSAFLVLERQREQMEAISSLFTSMSEFRAEHPGLAISPAQKNQYLTMAAQLSAGIEAFEDERVMAKVRAVMDIIGNNAAVLTYDPRQDGFWRKNVPSLVQTLDDLVIAVGRDALQSMDQKHHVFQAVKYLSVATESAERREAMYDTILPAQGPVPISLAVVSMRAGTATKLVSTLLGTQYELVEDGTTLDAGRGTTNLNDLIQLAQEHGYTTLKLQMTEKDSAKLAKEFPEQATVQGPIEPKRLGGKLMPLTYPVTGALPGKIQDWLEYRYTNFKSVDAFTISCTAELVASVGTAGALALANSNPWYLLAGALGVADTIVRSIVAAVLHEKTQGEHKVGSIFLKPFFAPVEELAERNTNLLNIELRLPQAKPMTFGDNPVPYLERLAVLNVDDRLEDNLEWGPENHNDFGNEFVAAVTRFTSAPIGKGRNKQQASTMVAVSPDRKNSAVIYQQQQSLGGYHKLSVLICRSGERYMVTAITESPVADVASGIAAIVGKKGAEPLLKFQDVMEMLNPAYVHFRRFAQGETTHNYEMVR